MLLNETRRRRKLNEDYIVTEKIKEIGLSFPVVNAELVYRKLDDDFRGKFSLGRFREAIDRVNNKLGYAH